MSDAIDKARFENERIKDNMHIWKNVCKTNPKHTKHVAMRGGFTAIDPYYQIRCATEELGPAGEGWGWKILDHFTVQATNQLAILVELWHGSRDNTICQWGQAGLYSDKGCTRPDGDCFKKATTDGITKCLSYLGFNADVFTGKFDDNKYVQEVQKEFDNKEKAEQQAESKQYQEEASKVVATIHTCESEGDLKKAYEDNASTIESMSEGAKQEVRAAYKTKLDTFKQE